LFLRRVGPELRRRVAAWTGEHTYMINLVLKEMISRCRELNLRAVRPAEELKLDAAILMTMHITQYLQSGAHRLPL